MPAASPQPTRDRGCPCQHLLYQQLGDRYLGQERYADSAAAYRAYATERFPDSKVAHQMQLRVIASYEAGISP